MNYAKNKRNTTYDFIPTSFGKKSTFKSPTQKHSDANFRRIGRFGKNLSILRKYTSHELISILNVKIKSKNNVLSSDARGQLRGHSTR